MMLYLLLTALVSYSALAVLSLERHGERAAGRVTGVLFVFLVLGAGGELVLGTASDPALAMAGAVISLCGLAAASLTMPLALLTQHLERLPLFDRGRVAWVVGGAWVILPVVAIAALVGLSGQPVVAQSTGGDNFIIPATGHPAVVLARVVALSGPVVGAGVAAYFLYRGRFGRGLDGWVMLAGTGSSAVVQAVAFATGRWLGPLLLAGTLVYMLARGTHRQATWAVKATRPIVRPDGGVNLRDPMAELAQEFWSGPRIQTVLAEALDTVLQATGLDSALVYLREAESPDVLHMAASYSASGSESKAPQQLGVPDSRVGSAILRGEAVLLNGSPDAGNDPQQPDALREADMKSGLVAPLQARGNTLGALVFLARQPRDFPREEVLLLESIGRQLGAAYDSAYLHAAEHRQRVQAEVLNDIVMSMAGATSLDDIAEAVLEHLPRIIDYDSAAVSLFSEDYSHFRAGRGFSERVVVAQSLPTSEMPVHAHLREHKRLLRIDDTHEHPLWRTDILAGPRIRSAINVPLIIRDDCIGALSVDSHEVGHFTEADGDILQRVANHLTLAVDNARLADETRERNKILSALNDLSATISGSLELDAVLDRSLAVVTELTDFGAADIYLLEESGERLVLRARHNPAGKALSGTRIIRRGEGISGRVVETGKPIVTQDYRSDPRRLSDELDIQTLVSIPLVSKGQIIGTLALIDQGNRPVSDRDLELLVAIGLQLGVAIDNAKLYELALARARVAAQLSLLGVRLTASLDVNETYDLICRHVLDIFDAEGAYVWLVEGEELVGAAGLGRGSEQFVGTRVRVDDSVTLSARVVRERGPLYVNNTTRSTVNQELIEVTGCKSLLGTPLIREEQIIGSIVVVSTQDPQHFSDVDLISANLLSAHAALAIDNASLFEKATHQLRQLQLVQEVSRDVMSHLDIDLLLAAVAERVWTAFGYYVVAIVVREGDELVPRAVLRRGEDLVNSPNHVDNVSSDGIIATVLERGEPVLAPDVSKEDIFNYKDVFSETKSELTVPLILAGDVLGALDVQSDRVGGLTATDLELLQPLAAQIAISLSNAQLFQTVRDYTTELEARVDERTQRIREHQERTDAILRSVADAVVVVNLRGEIVLTNPVADRLLDNRTESASVRREVREFIYDLARQAEDSSARRLDLEGISLEAHASKLVEAGRVQGSVIVLHDVTHLYELDRMKSHFVSTVSHELRTPLSNLKLYLSLLQAGKPEQREGYLDTMQRETARLQRLIDDLLDLSRIDDLPSEEVTRSPVNLNELVRVVVDNHRPQSQAGRIGMQTTLDDTLPLVKGDRNQLIQVLTNLVANALAYTPEGGDVWVRSATESSSDGMRAAVIVEDSGVGIGPDECERIFDRFYRGMNSKILEVPGSGLGLAIVKEIVELHGGEISVSSAVGVGSTFKMVLPVSHAEIE